MYCLARSQRHTTLATRYIKRVFSDGKKNGRKGNKAAEGKYSSTVQLPTTEFSQRANAAQREPELQQYWTDNNIFGKVNTTNKNGSYVLHDGPPYANGDLHIGHALNKILKDFIVKYQLLRGQRVSYIPGWDCHGLPIEMKVLQRLKSKEKKELTPLGLRAQAHSLATSTLAAQSKSFQRYGVWGDWEQPYATLQPRYEAQQLRVFGEMVRRGFVYRGEKPVHWSPSSHTALAEAELEYPDTHLSTSVTVGLEVTSPSPVLAALMDQLPTTASPALTKMAIWTTTPWTLPANQAVAVNPSLIYSLITHPGVQNGAHFLVAKDLIPQFSAVISKSGLLDCEGEVSFTVLGELTGAELATTEYQHPVHSTQKQRVVVGGSYVTAESGTGLVHTAPGHGMDDYLTGLREGLRVVSPVDDYGRFTEEAGEALCKKEVLGAGNEAVIDMLRANEALLLVEDYPHKYPYDWRTGKPTITRTTPQWFASVEAFRDGVMEAIDGVEWVPAIGKKRISSMVTGRKDWCISRQRAWGVPIPVFYHVHSGEVLMTAESISHVEEVVREQGSDAWWRLGVHELLPPSLRHLAEEYVKGTDTMDVWFDSGTSWAGVLQDRSPASETSSGSSGAQHSLFPADLYLEGSDQHRGWFQSSLLTAVAATGQAPYKCVLTHGFVLDEKGHKMSKSLGNVVDPDTIINGGKNKKTQPAYGADTLRLWVAGVDFSSDVSIGDGIIKQTSDTYRKLRNTLRFLLGSLSDFDPAKDAIPVEQLPSLDKFMLGRLTETFESVDDAYASFQFNRASTQIAHFAINQLSNFYLDISKDRLYISGPDEWRRRACQTVLHEVFTQFVLMMAPLVPHMAEDAHQSHIQTHTGQAASPSSVFERGWLRDQRAFPSHEKRRWDFLGRLRGDVNQCIELARKEKLVGASQECAVYLFVDQGVPGAEEIMGDVLALTASEDVFSVGRKGHEGRSESVDDLRMLLLVSQVHVVGSLEELTSRSECHLHCDRTSGMVVGVKKAEGKRCARCWYFNESVEDSSEEVAAAREDRRDVCSRCAHVLSIASKTV